MLPLPCPLGGPRRTDHCYPSPRSSPDGKQKCPRARGESAQNPRGTRGYPRGAGPPSRRDAHAPCPPPPAPGSHAAAAPAPPAPRPRAGPCWSARDRRLTASQNAPPPREQRPGTRSRPGRESRRLLGPLSRRASRRRQPWPRACQGRGWGVANSPVARGAPVRRPGRAAAAQSGALSRQVARGRGRGPWEGQPVFPSFSPLTAVRL